MWDCNSLLEAVFLLRYFQYASQLVIRSALAHFFGVHSNSQEFLLRCLTLCCLCVATGTPSSLQCLELPSRMTGWQEAL